MVNQRPIPTHKLSGNPFTGPNPEGEDRADYEHSVHFIVDGEKP